VLKGSRYDSLPPKHSDKPKLLTAQQKPADLPDTPHENSPTTPKKAAELESEKKDTFAHVDTAGSSGTLSHTVGSTLKDTLPYTEGKQPVSVPGDGTDGIIQPFHSFVLAFTMIIFSEIGDKTFLVAALMAMRHPQLVVFSGAFSALITMTILSAVLGHAVPTLLPKHLTAWLAAGLFLIFGAKLMREGLQMDKDAGVGEEMQEVEAELEEKEHLARKEGRRRSSVSPYVLEAGRGRRSGSRHKFPARAQSPSSDSSRSPSPSGRGVKASASNALGGLNNLLGLLLSPAWVQTFIMTFLGEWGDRSQIATIAMAAGQDYWWVTGGAIAGHMICTGIAVIGGRALAGKVSLRVGKYISSLVIMIPELTYDSHLGWSNCFPSLWSHLLFRGFVRLDDVHII
jgi:putative Ca2+/H+ antiporter (TMEM165/GDT1 family)